MELNWKKSGESYIISVHRNIFSRTHINDLMSAVIEIISENGRSITIDLSELESIDAVGFGVFVSIQKTALIHDVDVKLTGLKSNIAQILEQTHINRVLNIHEAETQHIIKELYADISNVA